MRHAFDFFCRKPGGEPQQVRRFMRVLHRWNVEQELSYRQQIARQLRTQYTDGIYRHKYYTVTLKSRLRVTQGYWKQNHWIDHTWLSSSRVIWRLILLWPWNVGQRSLEVIESSTIWKLGYGFLFAFHSNYSRICSHFFIYSASKNGLTIKSGFWVRQGHWEWRGSIDHIWLSISAPL